MFLALKNLFLKYERYASFLAFAGGFIFDNFTLTRIDLWVNNLMLAVYLAVAGISIILSGFFYRRGERGKFGNKAVIFLPLIMQFSFGALFSGYFVYYSRSGSLAGSWLFILTLTVLLIGNEFFQKRYHRMEFQVSVFFTAVFSFFIFYIPVLLSDMGEAVFLLSGAVSVAVIAIFLWILAKTAGGKFSESRRTIILSTGVIYIILNIFYFTNIIPPIPLALKDADVYHFVARAEDGGYFARHEKRNWREWLPWNDKIFHIASGESVYFYSAVFAPTDLKTPIFHKWQYFNEARGEWVSSDILGFSIVGGRDGGYRGYSIKSNVFPGRWRVDIVTDRGQILGRESFMIKETKDIIEMEEDVL